MVNLNTNVSIFLETSSRSVKFYVVFILLNTAAIASNGQCLSLKFGSLANPTLVSDGGSATFEVSGSGTYILTDFVHSSTNNVYNFVITSQTILAAPSPFAGQQALLFNGHDVSTTNGVTYFNLQPGSSLSYPLTLRDPDYSGTVIQQIVPTNCAGSPITLTYKVNKTGALPLEWLSFIAKPQNTEGGNKIKLEWQTAAEKNVENFIIERSSDAKTFKKIGESIKANNIDAKNTYTTFDDKPQSGITYYRIRQNDFDGQLSFSKIQSVFLSGSKQNESKFAVYPNPLSKNSPINILTDVSDEYTLEIIDLTGKILYKSQYLGNAEIKDLTLTSGLYLYDIKNDEQHIMGKILVTN